LSDKAVGYSRRRKRRWSRKSRSHRLLYLSLVILLIAGLLLWNSITAVPYQAAQMLPDILPARGEFYRFTLRQVIPGVTLPVAARMENEKVAGVELRSLSSSLHPQRILATQIPYLAEAGEQSQSLVQFVGRGTEAAPGNHVPQILLPDKGKIIVYHAHTTESFLPTSGEKFTEDLAQTVVRLGAELARLLREEHAIPVVHNREIHDLPRSTAYEVALSTVRELLDAHPDALMLLDLHRDGVDRKISTTLLDGQATGRILFVVGSRHPGWQRNFAKALFLHEVLEEISPGLSRGVRERPFSYNQHLHPGALLIEIGGHENTLAEALRAVPYLARALARLYSEMETATYYE
jgi:stage II sporulation protein P